MLLVLAFAWCSVRLPCGPFPLPRSSNRTCGFPASGSQPGSCLRPRKVSRLQPKAHEAVISPQPLVGEAHVVSRPRLVLPPEPLSQPPGRVHVHGLLGRADLSEVEVVRPPGHHPVEALHDLFSGPSRVPPVRLLADPAADVPNIRLVRPGTDVPASVRRTIVPADAVSEDSHPPGKRAFPRRTVNCDSHHVIAS